MDHVGICVADLEAALAFYDAVFEPLRIRRLMSYGAGDGQIDHVGYGDGLKPFFWVNRGGQSTGPVHLAFAAPDRQAVDAFFDAGLRAGGRDNGPPGLRPHYHSGYYGAFILSPEGLNIEAVHHTFAAGPV